MHHTTQTVEQAQRDITAEVTEASSKAALQTKQQTLLQSLKYPGMNERRNHIKESHEATFRWALRRRHESASDESDDEREIDIWGHDIIPFIEWAQSDQSSYWISGKPGSGKSTLMKFIIESRETQQALQSWRPGCMILSHYFWKPGSDLQRNIKGLWCSIAYQRLLANDGPELISYVLKHFPDTRSKSEHSDWSLRDIVDVCLAILGRQSNPLCIFIDGLDEINDDDGVTALKHVLSTLSAKASGVGIKFCLASRPEPRFRAWLKGLPELKLHYLTRKDMFRLVNDRLSAPLADWGSDEEKAQMIKERLVYKADGVFLWLALAIKSVIRGLDEVNSEEEIQTRIEHLPTDMEELYSEMWNRVNGSDDIYHETAAKIFNLVIFAEGQDRFGFRPTLLSAMILVSSHYQELLSESAPHPISIDSQVIEEECQKFRYQVETRCAGLLDIVPSERPYRDRLVFIHRTAYDWLTTTARGRKLLGKSSSSESYSKGDMLRILFATRWLSDTMVHDLDQPRGDYRSARFFSSFDILLYSALYHGVEEASGLWLFLHSLESRLKGPRCIVTTPALRVANLICQLLLYYDSPYFILHAQVELAELLPQAEKGILEVEAEVIKGLSAVENASFIATVVLREYLLLGDLRHFDDYPAIRLLLEQSADSNAVGRHEFLDYPPPTLPEAFSQAMGSGTEWFLQRMLTEAVNPSRSDASRGTLELTQESFDILHLMIIAEDVLTRHSIVGHSLKADRFWTKVNQFWRSYGNNHWRLPPSSIGSGCVVYKVTLAHLLFPFLYLAPGEERLPKTSRRARSILRDFYSKCSVEPVRLLGILIEDDNDVRVGYQAYTIREIHPILPLTVTVGDFWTAILAAEMPDGQGGFIDLSNAEESLRKALAGRKLKAFEGHIDDFFAGETPGHAV